MLELCREQFGRGRGVLCREGLEEAAGGLCRDVIIYILYLNESTRSLLLFEILCPLDLAKAGFLSGYGCPACHVNVANPDSATLWPSHYLLPHCHRVPVCGAEAIDEHADRLEIDLRTNRLRTRRQSTRLQSRRGLIFGPLLVKLHVGTNIVPLQAPKVWVYLCGKEDTGVQDSCSSRKSCPNLQSSIIIIIII
jgi:hypothetical protein